MFTRLHHVGLVVRRLEDGLALWRDLLGLEVSAEATVEDQGVKAALLPIGRSEIELLEPINPNGGVAKFLERRGEGLHHVCFETADVAAELAGARAGAAAHRRGAAARPRGDDLLPPPEGDTRRARRVRDPAAGRGSSRAVG